MEWVGDVPRSMSSKRFTYIQYLPYDRLAAYSRITFTSRNKTNKNLYTLL